MRTSLLAALYLLLPHVLSSLPSPYEQISLAGTELLEQEVVNTSTIPPNLKKFLDCSIDNYRSTGFPFLKWAEPLSTEAFVQRRNKVAEALYSQGLDAFVAETEYPMRYYANFSWSLSERPMLMVVQPVMNTTDNTVYANTTFLVAAFEAGRLNLLDTAMGSPLSTMVWQEHWDPYATLSHSHIFASTESPKIMVEAEMRDFVSRSLGAAGFNVIGYGGEVEAVRQIKTKQEVEIMRAVNTGTVSAIREMRKCMLSFSYLFILMADTHAGLVPGLKGHEIQTVLQKTLLQAFTKSAFAIVAIGPQASSPHGGFGGEAELTEDDFILIDVGFVQNRTDSVDCTD
jgi:Xaa-Pro aminopeptidase